MKNKWIAAVLNVMPGIGYLYAGVRTSFALLLLAIWPLTVIASVTTSPEVAASEAPMRIWDWLPIVPIELAFIVDGYREAERVNANQIHKHKA